MVVYDGDDFLALLVFVARVANPIPPFLATVLVPSPWSTLVLRCFSAARCRTLAMNACESDPSSAHLALDRPRARSIAGLFSWRYLRQRGRPRCLGFRTVHVRFRSHGSSVVRLLSRAPSNRLAWEIPFRHFIHTSVEPGSCRMHAYSHPSRPHHRSHVSVSWALPQALASWEIPPQDLACG
jgi:hypothetical protein